MGFLPFLGTNAVRELGDIKVYTRNSFSIKPGFLKLFLKASDSIYLQSQLLSSGAVGPRQPECIQTRVWLCSHGAFLKQVDGRAWHVGPGLLTVVNHEELKKQ